ncbi:OmpA family protein [Fulvivirga ulvae]|uniref:OmpA family protein n=1 Tax=Fulvivirga ulvae TaxID=2904245 RepID=UPI001F32C6A9|nr:OmpA family protein [Fulvivirga ulvae]UII32880.1 OmpA family protein [Fulvivirga ulvae]
MFFDICPITKKTLALCISILVAMPLLTFAQKQRPSEMVAGYYVVVGAYSANKEHYARRYVDEISKAGKEVDYGFNSKKNLFFVYLDYSQNYKAAISEMRRTRENEQFGDAWVFVCSGGSGLVMTEEEKQRAEKTTEALNKEVGKLDDLYAEKFDKEEKNKGENAGDKGEPATEDEVGEGQEEIAEGGNNITKAKTGTLSDYQLLFILENARNSKEVKGDVQIIDAERAKLLTVVPGDEQVELSDPNNGTGELTLICDVFGFRKSQKSLNYYHPFKDTISTEINVLPDVYVVNFDLVRYHVGDIVVMYNVYYYNDAAVMRPDSKYEVNSLLEMMKENPNYKIRIHGHTNGKSPGKIITMGDSDKYFALADSNKQGFGSAKQLSKERAEIIKSYLVDEGIAADRMEIKAWGGRRMLYDKFSPQAKHNVRVEIEILEE